MNTSNAYTRCMHGKVNTDVHIIKTMSCFIVSKRHLVCEYFQCIHTVYALVSPLSNYDEAATLLVIRAIHTRTRNVTTGSRTRAVHIRYTRYKDRLTSSSSRTWEACGGWHLHCRRNDEEQYSAASAVISPLALTAHNQVAT